MAVIVAQERGILGEGDGLLELGASFVLMKLFR